MGGAGQRGQTGTEDVHCREGSPRADLPPPSRGPVAPSSRKASLLPLQRLRRRSVRPGVVVPRVRVSKAPAPTFQPERPARKGSTKDSGHLQIPKWRYKEAKEEKRKAEEAEKKRQAEAQKEAASLRIAPRTLHGPRGHAHFQAVCPGCFQERAGRATSIRLSPALLAISTPSGHVA